MAPVVGAARVTAAVVAGACVVVVVAVRGTVVVVVDVVEVDCGGGSGDGPSYVYAKNFQVVGRDIYGLDTDHDGIACES